MITVGYDQALQLFFGYLFRILPELTEHKHHRSKSGGLHHDGESRSVQTEAIQELLHSIGESGPNLAGPVYCIIMKKKKRRTRIKVEELTPLEFFDGYTVAEITQLIPYLEVFIYKPEDGPIFDEDLRKKGIQLILEGEVHIVKEVNEETGIVLATLRRGEIIGEASMFDEGPHTASVEAVERTRTVAITRMNYFSLIKEAPHLAVKIANKAASILSNRLRQANEAVLTYAVWSQSLSKNPPPTFWRWYAQSTRSNMTDLALDLDKEIEEQSGEGSLEEEH